MGTQVTWIHTKKSEQAEQAPTILFLNQAIFVLEVLGHLGHPRQSMADQLTM